jgi:serine/threonine protein kinase
VTVAPSHHRPRCPIDQVTDSTAASSAELPPGVGRSRVRAAINRLAARLNAAIGTGRDGVRETLRPGGRLGGYGLVTQLAMGMTAEVWLAKITGEQGFEKAIALKALRPDATRLAELVRAFTSEAAVAAKLYHPNIVQLVDCGQMGDRYYIAMEYVDGLTLSQMATRLRELGRRFPVRPLVQIALQTCAALHHAHELCDSSGWVGLLHRDVNPDNVMVTPLGAVKVIDFGSAQLACGPTPAWALGGETAYMAPERFRGLLEDRRSDIYSLGVVLYEQATGQRPYDGDEISLVARIIEGHPVDPRELAPDLPEDLTRIILKAMAARPDDRYPTAELLAGDLQRFIDHHYAHARREQSQPLDFSMQEVFSNPGGAESADPLFTPPVPTPIAPPIVTSPSREPPSPSLLSYALEVVAEVTGSDRERFAPDAHNANEEITRPAPNVGRPSFAAARHGDETAPTDTTEVDGPPRPEDLPPVEAADVDDEEAPAPLTSVFDRARPSGLSPEIFTFNNRTELTGSFFNQLSTTPATVVASNDHEPFAGFSPTGIHQMADIFAVRRGGNTVERSAEWTRGPAPPPRTPPPEVPPPEAARCFDRGLAYLGSKDYDLALPEWERACQLEPENRTYQTNLKRLRARMQDRDGADTRKNA